MTMRPVPGRGRGRRRTGLLLPALLVLAAAGPSPEDLRDAERSRAASQAAEQAAAARAGEAADAEQRLVAKRIAAAAALQQAEAASSAAAARIDELTRRERAAESKLGQSAADLTPLLPVMQRLSLYPAETLLAMPLPPEQSVRGVIVLGEIARQAAQQAAALRQQQAEVAALRTGLATELPRLQATRQIQASLAEQLDAQIAAAQAARRDAQDEATQAERRAAAEAARADSLRTAIARLEAARAAEMARARVAESARASQTPPQIAAAQRGEAAARLALPSDGLATRSLTAPVAGTIVHGFGQETDAGTASGIAYQAVPSARVVAPCNGRVVFAGPFRSFGLLLIEACGGGYHCVLAGFARLDVAVGTRLQAGEPVGVMPGFDPRGTDGRPLLTLELRREGAPVNPAPFLRGRG